MCCIVLSGAASNVFNRVGDCLGGARRSIEYRQWRESWVCCMCVAVLLVFCVVVYIV